MTGIRLLLPGLAVICLCTSSLAQDLSKIDRTIQKEPAYQAQPKYCLLVFGPEAKHRVWLVLDGDRLYVDRNGNGDLTEEGERIAPDKEYSRPNEGTFYFKAGDLHEGNLLHKGLTVSVSTLESLADFNEDAKAHLAKYPDARRYGVGIDLEKPGFRGVGLGGRIVQFASVWDANGFLRFTDSPQDAPVIHFGGPLIATFYSKSKLTIGRESEPSLAVGTPGVGPGTTAWVGYEELIPKSAYARVEIVYPPKVNREAPVKELYELKERC